MHVALSGQVVGLIGTDGLDNAIESTGIGHISVMEKEPGTGGIAGTGVLEMVDTAPIHAGRPAHNPMHFITFTQQKLGQIRTILPCNSRDQSDSRHDSRSLRCGPVMASASASSLIQQSGRGGNGIETGSSQISRSPELLNDGPAVVNTV